MNALLGLSRAIDAMSERIGRIVYWLILVVVLISAANATIRKVFNYSSNAYLEIQWYLFSAVFLFGAGYTLLRNEHVRIDIIAGRLSPRAQNWIDVFGILFFLFPMAAVPGFVDAARGIDQCGRAHHLAGADPGPDRLLAADPAGDLGAHQARCVPDRQWP